MDWIKIRILLKKLEAQLRYDVLPDGDEREELRKHIAECEEYLAHWDGSRTDGQSTGQMNVGENAQENLRGNSQGDN